MVLSKNHTASTTQHPLTRPPPTALRTHAHNHPSMLKLLKSPANIPRPPISRTSRHLSVSNLNLSTVSAATTFKGKPFHALSTLWVKVPNLTTVFTLFFTLRLWPLVLSLSIQLNNSSALMSIPFIILNISIISPRNRLLLVNKTLSPSTAPHSCV